MVDNRQAVQLRGACFDGFLNTDRRFFVTVQTGIGIDGAGKQIALFLQRFEQRDVFIHQRHARAWLAERFAFLIGF